MAEAILKLGAEAGQELVDTSPNPWDGDDTGLTLIEGGLETPAPTGAQIAETASEGEAADEINVGQGLPKHILLASHRGQVEFHTRELKRFRATISEVGHGFMATLHERQLGIHSERLLALEGSVD
ncbi:MAG: hypothetical protein AAB971_02735 [Patescibacteria group bacterium]